MNEHFLTDIEIKQFKCFSNFKASGLKRVNLIGGKNNIGKTAFMEACLINVYSSNINVMITAICSIKVARENLNLIGNSFKYIAFLDSTRSYAAKSNLRESKFYIQEIDAIKTYNFEIDGKSTKINANELSIVPIENYCFIDNFGWSDLELACAYQAIQKNDQENNLNDFIGAFDDTIEGFKVIGNKPQCKTKGEYRDIVEFGDGLRHYISIICALYTFSNGYLFVDEIDNGVHYSQLERLWELILTLSKETHCQVFAVTHSKEMLEAFARVAKKLDDQDVSCITLVKNKQQEIKAITRDYDTLLDSIEQDREVRGW